MCLILWETLGGATIFVMSWQVTMSSSVETFWIVLELGSFIINKRKKHWQFYVVLYCKLTPCLSSSCRYSYGCWEYNLHNLLIVTGSSFFFFSWSLYAETAVWISRKVNTYIPLICHSTCQPAETWCSHIISCNKIYQLVILAMLNHSLGEQLNFRKPCIYIDL